MTNPPAGDVTFLFTDVQGSTVLWEQQSDLMNEALAEHDQLMMDAILAHDGYVFSTAGDSFGAAFPSADDAIAAAIAAQRQLLDTTSSLKLRIRMGLNTGAAAIRDDNYFGVEVNRAARIMSAGHGGQVLFSQATRDQLKNDTPNTDLGEHLLKDLARPERIFQATYASPEPAFPPLATVERPSSDLPTPLTTFIGREAELTTIGHLLAGHRLVTLTGSGGAGKTRLALQTAADARYQFPDGVRLVELAGVVDPDVLVDEVAQVFGVQAVADTPLADTLASSIGSRRGLLVLDNCEQLVAAVSDLVAQVLPTCPNLKILTTSRELLNLNSEVVYRVPSLAIPAPGAAPATLLDYDAISLFMERAALSNREFKLTAETSETVIAICRRLDGIPLALELAAARLRVMSPAQIAERLDHRFLSVGGEKSVASRHQTLQNTIDWSYNLLGHDEQMLFRRLSVFTGNFPIEAIEAVCSGAPVAETAIAELLFGLVDKSMVTHDTATGGATRYHLLQSMRDYGLRQLDEKDELSDLLGWHLDYYTDLADELHAMRSSGDLGGALISLDKNEDNIRAALRFSLLDARHEQAATMIGALGYLWYAGGFYREGSEWCAELFAAQPDLPDDAWAAVLHVYGTLLGSWAQPRVGAKMLEQEVVLRRKLGDPARLAAALNNLGNLQHDVGEFPEGETNLREAIELFRLAGESPTLALSSLGAGYQHTGQLEQAVDHFALALEEAAIDNNTYALALATGSLGQCAELQGDYVKGRELLEEARAKFELLTVTPGVASSDFHIARVDRAEGAIRPAATRLLASLSAPEAHWYLATQYWIMQTAASIINDDECAANLLGAAKAHYDRSEEIQPVFVRADLDATTADLRSRIDRNELERWLAKGRRLSASEAIASTVAALHLALSETQETTNVRSD